MSKSKIKVMSIDFFDVRGIAHAEILPPGQNIKAHLQGRPATFNAISMGEAAVTV